jgi:hypothetical protein
MKTLIFVTSAEKEEVRLYEKEIYIHDWWNWDYINHEYIKINKEDKETDWGFAHEVEKAIEKIAKEENLKGDYEEYNYDWGSITADDIWSF